MLRPLHINIHVRVNCKRAVPKHMVPPHMVCGIYLCMRLNAQPTTRCNHQVHYAACAASLSFKHGVRKHAPTNR